MTSPDLIEPNHRILIIDDNQSIHDDLRKILVTEGESKPDLDRQDRLVSVAFHAFGFCGADIMRLVDLGYNVKPVEDIEGLGTFLANYTQNRSGTPRSDICPLPH